MDRALLLSCLLGVACAGSDDDSDVAASPCAEETRGDTLAVGDTFASGGVTVEVTALEPEPPEVGRNAWTLSLSGLPEGCTVAGSTSMPDHGHGSDAGTWTLQDGTVDVSELEISMGGYWEVDVTVTCEGGEDPEAIVTLPFCVDA